MGFLVGKPALLLASDAATSPSLQQIAAYPQSAIEAPQSELPAVADALRQISQRFTWLDWGVIVVYLVFTTILGALLAGRQATIRDFFLGGRKLPWLAVWGSIIATEFSAASFLIVPALVFKPGGNFAYLQLAVGTIIARFIIGYFFVPAFYEREIYSPYDYMGNRLGARVKKIATALFVIGAVLAQGARIYIAALAFQVITGTNIALSISLMGAISILWAWIGGIRTVIWTDVIQFILFSVGAVIAFIYIGHAVEGGWAQVFRESLAAGRLRLIDTSFDTKTAYTLWCGLFATGWLTLASHGTDQVMAQRMFTCRDASAARKAIVWSSVSQIITVMLLLIGAGLYVFYQHHPFDPAEQAVIGDDVNKVFAVFIVDVLPPGLSGLVMAAIFAAAISTVESVLAALAQATESTVYRPLCKSPTTPRQDVIVSRLLVAFWGVALTIFALFCDTLQRHYGDLIQFALAMTAYTYGALLGMFLLALLPTHRNDLGLVWSVPLSMLTVFALEWHTFAAQIVVFAGAVILTVSAASRLWRQSLKVVCIGLLAVAILLIEFLIVGEDPESGRAIHVTLAWPWHYPLGTAITFAIGYWVGERRPTASQNA